MMRERPKACRPTETLPISKRGAGKWGQSIWGRYLLIDRNSARYVRNRTDSFLPGNYHGASYMRFRMQPAVRA